MNDDILDFIYNARSEELAKINEKNREFLNSPKADMNKNYKSFIRSLDNLPKETKSTIIENFNTCSDTADLIHAYFYKKYYKLGFSECMKLIINCNKF